MTKLTAAFRNFANASKVTNIKFMATLNTTYECSHLQLLPIMSASRSNSGNVVTRICIYDTSQWGSTAEGAVLFLSAPRQFTEHTQ